MLPFSFQKFPETVHAGTSIHSTPLALHLAHVSLPASTSTAWQTQLTDLHLKCSYLCRAFFPFGSPPALTGKVRNVEEEENRGGGGGG